MFLGEPVGIDGEVAKGEIGGFGGLLTGDKEKSVMLSGEVAGRIDSIPTVKELIDGVIKEAEEIIQSMPSKFVA
jgi:NAD(P)H-dependent flavin oxidoreductase YrpB (nitropropane dioxygenase family)